MVHLPHLRAGLPGILVQRDLGLVQQDAKEQVVARMDLTRTTRRALGRRTGPAGPP